MATFKANSKTVTSSTPDTMLTGASGVNTLVASINLANPNNVSTPVDVWYNDTTGDRLLASFTLSPRYESGCVANLTNIMLSIGHSIKVSTAGGGVGTTVSYSESV